MSSCRALTKYAGKPTVNNLPFFVPAFVWGFLFTLMPCFYREI